MHEKSRVKCQRRCNSRQLSQSFALISKVQYNLYARVWNKHLHVATSHALGMQIAIIRYYNYTISYLVLFPIDWAILSDLITSLVWSSYNWSLHSYWTNPDAWSGDLRTKEFTLFIIKSSHNKVYIKWLFLTIIHNSDSHIASRYSLKPRLLNVQVISSKIDSLLSCVELY